MPTANQTGVTEVSHADVLSAGERIAGCTRPVALLDAAPGAFGAAEGCFADEFRQHTGSFKARGAASFTAAAVEAGEMPPSGVVIASGGNAGLACAWAASQYDVPATVFLPRTAPAVKVDKLAALGAEVRQVGDEYSEALEASRRYARESGALESHAYDHPLIAAGAGTLLEEIRTALPELDTVVVAVGGGGLFAGVAAAASQYGVRVVAAEPENCRALNAAVEAGHPVDVPVDSVASDSLGARRASRMALEWARRAEVASSVLVPDGAIVGARADLWERYGVAVEHAAGTAWATVRSGAYAPEPGERVCVVLCGSNTDPTDLSRG